MLDNNYYSQFDLVNYVKYQYLEIYKICFTKKN